MNPTSARGWPVFVAYVIAIVTIVLSSLVAIAVLRASHPDVPDTELVSGVEGLIAGALASSTALLLTVVAVSQPFDPKALRLMPGRERGLDLAAAITGMLALGQTLDSLSLLLGFGRQGTMPAIRRALTGVQGGELLAAVIVLGVLAGTAEEVFFRAYMQTRLRAAWRAGPAIAVTSAAFGLLHMEWTHAVMACVLGVYLGIVTERMGSALPAVASHVVNNVVFTVATALWGAVDDRRTNVTFVVLSLAVLGACAFVLARRARASPPGGSGPVSGPGPAHES